MIKMSKAKNAHRCIIMIVLNVSMTAVKANQSVHTHTKHGAKRNRREQDGERAFTIPSNNF